MKIVLYVLLFSIYALIELANYVELSLSFYYSWWSPPCIEFDLINWITIISMFFAPSALIVQLLAKKDSVRWWVLLMIVIEAAISFAVIAYCSQRMSAILLADKVTEEGVLPVTCLYIFPILGLILVGLTRQIIVRRRRLDSARFLKSVDK